MPFLLLPIGAVLHVFGVASAVVGGAMIADRITRKPAPPPSPPPSPVEIR